MYLDDLELEIAKLQKEYNDLKYTHERICFEKDILLKLAPAYESYGYNNKYKTDLELPLPLQEQLGNLGELKDLLKQLHSKFKDSYESMNLKIVELSIKQRMLNRSKNLGLKNDTLNIENNLVEELQEKTCFKNLKPSNFKNKICSNLGGYTSSLNYEGEYPNFYANFYKIAEGFERKIDIQVTCFLSNQILYVYLLDLRTNIRTTFSLSDLNEEATVELHMWVKGTDNYIPASKLPSIPREDFIKTILETIQK
jgi:hypothetical protein